MEKSGERREAEAQSKCCDSRRSPTSDLRYCRLLPDSPLPLA